MVPVPEGVVLSYNGFTFGPYVKTKVTETTVPMSDDRNVKCSAVHISVSGWFTQDDAGGGYTFSSVTVLNAGANYHIGDVLTVQGGTSSLALQILVTNINGGGGVTAISPTTGEYSVTPENPVSVSGGAGAGATFEIQWGEPSWNTLDGFMLSLRRRLQVNGQNLQYLNKGYGVDLDINNPDPDEDSIRDVQMGPKPGKLLWWPLGGAPDGCHGAGFTWEITTWIAECSEFQIAPGVFIDCSFTASYETDEAGLVTIGYRGSLQIPMSLNAAGLLDFNVDSQFGAVITSIVGPRPVGFLRKISRQISTDRATVTFTVSDKQLEVPPPDNAVSIEMKHRVRQWKPGSPIWAASISGTIRIDPSADRLLAYTRFWNIVAQRMAISRSRIIAARGAEAAAGCIVPEILEMEEDLFKNESRFSISYRIIGTTFPDLIARSGLWAPLVNTAYPATSGNPEPAGWTSWTAKSWTESLRGGAQATLGLLGAQFDNNSEIIINVCAGIIPPSSDGKGGPG